MIAAIVEPPYLCGPVANAACLPFDVRIGVVRQAVKAIRTKTQRAAGYFLADMSAGCIGCSPRRTLTTSSATSNRPSETE